jgi:hypothetical protein
MRGGGGGGGQGWSKNEGCEKSVMSHRLQGRRRSAGRGSLRLSATLPSARTSTSPCTSCLASPGFARCSSRAGDRSLGGTRLVGTVSASAPTAFGSASSLKYSVASTDGEGAGEGGLMGKSYERNRAHDYRQSATQEGGIGGCASPTIGERSGGTPPARRFQ